MARSSSYPVGAFGFGRFRSNGGILPFGDTLSFEPWTYESWGFDIGYH